MKLSLKISLAIGLIALVIIPAIGFVSFFTARKIIEERIEREQADLARRTLHEIDLRLNNGWKDIRLLGGLSLNQQYIEDREKEKLTKFLNEKLLLTGPWDMLMAVDKEGEILSSTAGFPFGTNIDAYSPNAEAFYQALAGKIAATDVHFSKIGGRATLAFASPIFDVKKERVLGVVIGQIAWPIVMEILDGLGSEYRVFLANQKGEVIATRTRDRATIFQDSLLDNHLFQRTGLKTRGTYFETGHSHREGEKSLSALAIQEGLEGFKDHRWRLLLEVPEAIVFEPVKEMAQNIALGAGALLLLLAATVFFVVSRVTQPMESLSQTMIDVGRGNLNLRATISTKDEVGQLAEAFNQMLEELGETRKEILRSKDYTDNIIKSMVDSLIVINPDATIRTVNQATLDLLGYTEKELIGQPIGRILAEEEEEEEEEEALFKGTSLEKLIREGVIKDHGLIYRTKGGERIPMSFSGSVMYEGTRDQGPGTRGDHGPSTMDQKKMVNGQWSLVTSPAKQIVGIVGVAQDMTLINRSMQRQMELQVETAEAAESEREKAAELENVNKGLTEQTKLLEDFHMLVVDRELAMIKLKGEVNALLEKLGESTKYEEGEIT